MSRLPPEAGRKSMRCSSRPERMFVDPVPRNVHPPAHPYPVVLPDVVEEALQRFEPPGPAKQTAVHPDRHHLRPFLAFGVEHVEGVLEIGEEGIAGVETLR